jgi:hypothetical protein
MYGSGLEAISCFLQRALLFPLLLNLRTRCTVRTHLQGGAKLLTSSANKYACLLHGPALVSVHAYFANIYTLWMRSWELKAGRSLIRSYVDIEIYFKQLLDCARCDPNDILSLKIRLDAYVAYTGTRANMRA